MVKRKDEKIVTFDYDELLTYSDTICELVPLSQRDVSVLVSCLRVAGWTARWFGGEKLLREIGRFTDLETALTYIESLERKILEVGCLEGLIDVMGEIRDAIRLQANCCLQAGNPYSLIDIGDGELAFGTQQPLTEPPEGEFEDEEAYTAHRCAAANVIVADLISGFNQFSVVSLSAIIAGGLVVALVATPPAGIFYALLLASFSFAACELISNYIDDNRQELVCMLYNAETYSEWQIAITDWVAEMTIELEVLGFDFDITNLIRSMVSTDVWNGMYTALYLPTAENPVDCANCEEGSDYHWAITAGSAEYQGDDVWRITAAVYAPWDRYSFIAEYQDANNDPVGFNITNFDLVSGTTPEWYGKDGLNWNNFPISSSFDFDNGAALITFDTQSELFEWTADITVILI